MVTILIIAVLSVIAQLFMPWWVIAPIAFAICFWRSERATKAFLAGAISILLVWALYAGFLNYQNEGLLASRMSDLLFKNPNSSALLLIVTSLLGGLVGGLAGLAGFYIRQVFIPRSSTQQL